MFSLDLNHFHLIALAIFTIFSYRVINGPSLNYESEAEDVEEEVKATVQEQESDSKSNMKETGLQKEEGQEGNKVHEIEHQGESVEAAKGTTVNDELLAQNQPQQKGAPNEMQPENQGQPEGVQASQPVPVENATNPQDSDVSSDPEWSVDSDAQKNLAKRNKRKQIKKAKRRLKKISAETSEKPVSERTEQTRDNIAAE